ncbi:MAG: hypothetical protein QXH92_03795 [Candidatus Aenigmatarchaeota archaeon]
MINLKELYDNQLYWDDMCSLISLLESRNSNVISTATHVEFSLQHNLPSQLMCIVKVIYFKSNSYDCNNQLHANILYSGSFINLSINDSEINCFSCCISDHGVKLSKSYSCNVKNTERSTTTHTERLGIDYKNLEQEN